MLERVKGCGEACFYSWENDRKLGISETLSSVVSRSDRVAHHIYMFQVPSSAMLCKAGLHCPTPPWLLATPLLLLLAPPLLLLPTRWASSCSICNPRKNYKKKEIHGGEHQSMHACIYDTLHAYLTMRQWQFMHAYLIFNMKKQLIRWDSTLSLLKTDIFLYLINLYMVLTSKQA